MQQQRRPAAEDRTSPAAVVAAAAGVPSVLFALNASSFAVALFLALVALAAVPLALSDRAGARSTRLLLVGAVTAVLALALVGRMLVGEDQRVRREAAPLPTASAAPAAGQAAAVPAAPAQPRLV